MNVRDAYNEWSQTYDSDSNATRDLDHRVLAQVVGGQRFKSIIEIGCGTGKNTELLSSVGGRVLALDFSAGMIGRAQEKLGRRSNVTLSVADVTQRWPVTPGSADLVTCNLVLEHVRDLSSVFVEAARALNPGGLLVVCELHPFRQYDGAVANFRRGEHTTEIPAFVHHLSDFLDSAQRCGFGLKSLREWWHEKDEGKPPRLVSFLFARAVPAG